MRRRRQSPNSREQRRQWVFDECHDGFRSTRRKPKSHSRAIACSPISKLNFKTSRKNSRRALEKSAKMCLTSTKPWMKKLIGIHQGFKETMIEQYYYTSPLKVLLEWTKWQCLQNRCIHEHGHITRLYKQWGYRGKSVPRGKKSPPRSERITLTFVTVLLQPGVFHAVSRFSFRASILSYLSSDTCNN